MDIDEIAQLIESHNALLVRLQGLEARAVSCDLLIRSLLQFAKSPPDIVQAFLHMIEISVANKNDIQHAKRWVAAAEAQFNEAARSRY